MDDSRFDALARSLTTTPSRRTALRLLAGGALAAALGLRGREAGAIDFGCLRVGKPCKRNRRCCSGICRNGTCRGHGKGTCAAGKNNCTDGSTCNGRTDCYCWVTTGNGPFCGTEAPCMACTRDADCAADPRFGPGAACIQAAACNCDIVGNNPLGTACARPCPAPA